MTNHAAAAIASSPTVLIWSYEHRAWWKPASRGYTEDREEAGLYTREEANQIVADANKYCQPGKPNEGIVELAKPERYDCDKLADEMIELVKYRFPKATDAIDDLRIEFSRMFRDRLHQLWEFSSIESDLDRVTRQRDEEEAINEKLVEVCETALAAYDRAFETGHANWLGEQVDRMREVVKEANAWKEPTETRAKDSGTTPADQGRPVRPNQGG